MGKSKEKIFSVSEITTVVKELLEQNIGNIYVKGEISDLSMPKSGHIYFSLKDEFNTIRVALFKYAAGRLNLELKDGQEVIVFGKITIYGKKSEYQIIAQDIQMLGIGDLLIKFEKLKKKLVEKGLFDEARKRQIPKFPKKIGIITSITGAAIRDILNIISRRYTNLEILIMPVLVQGEEAPSQIIKAIKDFNEFDDIDVIIIARGGGSIDDLWAFNDENLAYAIYESRIPIISAVGHEIDFTIADFVADLRAPTPSAAAELVVPDKKELLKNLESLKKNIYSLVKTIIKRCSEKLKALIGRYGLKIPERIFDEQVQRIDDIIQNLDEVIDTKFKDMEEKLKSLTEKLNILNPLSILKKGFSIVYDSKGNLVKESNKVSKGEDVKIKLYKGKIVAEVKEKE